jgi:ribonuclease HI
MINDFPAANAKTATSLFADDSAIWRSGRNLKESVEKLKPEVQKIVCWCDEWGFKLNENKTTAVIFSNKNSDLQSSVPILINNKLITTAKTIKFLGLTFDQRLNWTEHINKVTDNCKNKINLLRSLTGHQWGASKTALLKIYRTLIRPRLEYGSELFFTATKKSLQKIETIQNTCLRIATGAMKGTSTDALLQECGELPIALRRKRSTLRYIGKIKTSNINPAKEILEDTWENHYGKYKATKEPIFIQHSEFINYMEVNTADAQIISRSPWQKTSITIDISLKSEIDKNDDVAIKRSLSNEKLQQYSDHLQVYTDASKTATGDCGAAYYIPQYCVDYKFALPATTSIQTAELISIKNALEYLKNTNTEQKRKVIIITDSLEAVQSIEAAVVSLHKSTATDIIDVVNDMYAQETEVTLLWLPGHVGIQGNEVADRLAKLASSSHTPMFLDVYKTQTDINKYIAEIIEKEWQSNYNNSPAGKHYKQLEPIVSNKIKFTSSNRHKETTITRLRLGKCRLNYYLHKINKHPTGLCDFCNQPETIQHFILECPHYNILRSAAISDIRDAFSSKNCVDQIYTNILRLHRII